MFCTQCGTQITAEAKFCGNCGAAVPQDNGALASSASKVPAPPAETFAPYTVSTARPWPRFFARSIDTLLFSVFVSIVFLIAIPEAFLVLAFYFFIGPFTLLLWAFLESAILARGNTLGKWLMGVRVRSVDGNRSSFAQLLQRNFRVLWRGLGLGLPIIGLITNILAYDDLKKNGSTSWDREGNFKVFYSRIGWPKVVVAVLLAFTTLFIFAITQRVIESRVEYLVANPGHIQSASEPSQSSIAAPTSQQNRSQQISTDTAANTAARAKAEADKKDAEGRDYLQNVLENQLGCGLPPNPSIIRIRFELGFLRSTVHGSDGVPVLAPTIPLTLFGKRVTFMAGWGPEPDGSFKEPFSRGPGTAPPVHIAVSLDALPAEVAYKETESLDSDGLPFYSHSSIKEGTLDGSNAGSTITCYEGR